MRTARYFRLVLQALVVALLALGSACSSDSSSGKGDPDVAQVEDTATANPDTASDVAQPDVATKDNTQPEGDVTTDLASGDAPADDQTAAADTAGDWSYCDAKVDTNCLEIHRGESVFYQRISKFDTLEFDDEGTPRTVVKLSDLIQAEITETPENFRYQVFGTDEYTFGGYASWDQVMQGYMEVGARRVIWEPTLELPDSWGVKDSYRIQLSPAGN